MSTPATPTTPHDLLQTIESDLRAGVNWLEGEAVSIGATLWSDISSLFKVLGPKQVQIAYNVLGRISDDAIAGKSVEQIASDALNEAVGDELAAINSLGSGFQALVAIYKHSVTAKAA